jgi:hypothetical protein
MALSFFRCFKTNKKITPKPIEQAADQHVVNSTAPRKKAHVDFSLPVPRSALDVTPGTHKKDAVDDTAALAKKLATLLHLQVDPGKLAAAEDSPCAPTPGAVPLGLRAFSRHEPGSPSSHHDDPIQLATLTGHAGEQDASWPAAVSHTPKVLRTFDSSCITQAYGMIASQ